MSGETRRTRVRAGQVLEPDYYQQFQCTGGGCRYHCCQQWSITFSRSDYSAIKKRPKSPELQKLAEEKIVRIRGARAREQEEFFVEFQLVAENRHCPLQREDGLCRLQLECGEKALPKVCRVFPRSEGLGRDGVQQLRGDEVVVDHRVTGLEQPVSPEGDPLGGAAPGPHQIDAA